MLYREIIAVCSQIHTKHINTLCGQNAELLSFKPGGTYSDHWAFEVFKNRRRSFSRAAQFIPTAWSSTLFARIKEAAYIHICGPDSLQRDGQQGKSACNGQ